MTTLQFYRDEVVEGSDQVYYNVTNDQSLEEDGVYLLQNRSNDRIFWGFINAADTADDMNMSYLEENAPVVIMHPDPDEKRLWVTRPEDFYGPINLIIGHNFTSLS